MQARAREDLARLFATELAKTGLSAGEVVTYSTPRRLALIAHDLPAETAAVADEIKGPRASAPAQAVEGFLRKTGLTREALVERDGVLFAVVNKPGRATADVLAEAIPAIVRAFPWPKSMRWGAASISTESLRWVRPLHGIVALFGEEVVRAEVAGITSSATTLGHRFHHPGPITLGGAGDYVEKLRACHVIVDQAEREALIRDGAARLAAEAGLELIADEGLVVENAGLTEWPVPLLGRFDPAFLAVPPEVIQLTARVNQKYLVCRGADGALADAFVCTANIDAVDGGAAIVEGNRKVLAARLSDAQFFYEQDLRVPLEEQAAKLDRIVFHEKLGTVADKVERVAKLARWLVEEGIVPATTASRAAGTQFPGEGRGPVTMPIPNEVFRSQPPAELDPGLRRGTEDLAALAERAARLCKADLVTGMVSEFPELQGVMGGYYARAQGEDPQVADAIRDHYKPVGQGDEVPTAPVTVAVSLADKLDSIIAFHYILEGPSGSRDPFALRRQALAVLAVLQANLLNLPLSDAIFEASVYLGMQGWPFPHPRTRDEYLLSRSEIEARLDRTALPLAVESLAVEDLLAARFVLATHDVNRFFADRLKVQQREAGVRHDLIDAVFALGGEDDLVRLLARVRALQGFVGTEDGANLLAGYKRAANILKKEGWGERAPLSSEEELGVGTEPPGSGAAADGKPGAGAPIPTPGPPLQGRGELAPAEAALIAALDAAEPAAEAAIAREDFEAAMTALAILRAPIDAFFEQVTVNDPDPATRAARLDLLARVRAAVHRVADFSRIEG